MRYDWFLPASVLFAQAPAALILLPHPSVNNQTRSFNNNLSALTADGDAAIDPRFSYDLYPLRDDLSDKSTYMGALSLMFHLSKSPFEATSCGGRYVFAGSEDVEILIENPSGLPPGTVALETRYMMWGLYYTVKQMANENFLAYNTLMYWEEEFVGSVTIRKNSRPQLKGQQVPGSQCGGVAEASGARHGSAGFSLNNNHSSNTSAPYQVSAPPSLHPQTATKSGSGEGDDEVPGADNTNLTLGDAGRQVRIDFEGPRLPKYGIFMLTLLAMVTLAAFSQDLPSIKSVTLVDPQADAWFDIQASDPASQGGTPPFDYEKATRLLWRVPTRMYSLNRFEQCNLFLLEGGTEFGQGYFRKLPPAQEVAADVA